METAQKFNSRDFEAPLSDCETLSLETPSFHKLPPPPSRLPKYPHSAACKQWGRVLRGGGGGRGLVVLPGGMGGGTCVKLALSVLSAFSPV